MTSRLGRRTAVAPKSGDPGGANVASLHRYLMAGVLGDEAAAVDALSGGLTVPGGFFTQTNTQPEPSTGRTSLAIGTWIPREILAHRVDRIVHARHCEAELILVQPRISAQSRRS